MTWSHRATLLALIVLAVLGMFAVGAAEASAARPSQAVAEQRADLAVERLCGGGLKVCVKRHPVDVFYACGPHSKCWNACYTHVERDWWRQKRSYRCSTGKISWRSGHLNYYFEYPR